jgi:hypothetical protein
MNVSLAGSTVAKRMDHRTDELEGYSTATPMRSTAIGEDIFCESDELLEKYELPLNILVQWSRILRVGYVLKTARKPKIAYSRNYCCKSLKSPIKYILLYMPCSMYAYNVYNEECMWTL